MLPEPTEKVQQAICWHLVLQEAGYKVGLYTSPHLKDFRERIKINGKEVSKQFVNGFIKRNKLFFEANSLSFFEMTVGMAFEYFSKAKSRYCCY